MSKLLDQYKKLKKDDTSCIYMFVDKYIKLLKQLKIKYKNR